MKATVSRRRKDKISRINSAVTSHETAKKAQIRQIKKAIIDASKQGYSEVTLYLQGIVWYQDVIEVFTNLGYDIFQTNGGFIDDTEELIYPTLTLSWREKKELGKGISIHLDTKTISDQINEISDIYDDMFGDDPDTNVP